MDSHILSVGILGIFLLFIVAVQCAEHQTTGPAKVVGGKLKCHQCNIQHGAVERIVGCNTTTTEYNCAVCMKIKTTIVTGRRKPFEWEKHYDSYEVNTKMCLENAMDARSTSGCHYNQGAQGWSTVCYCSDVDFCNHGNRAGLSIATILLAAISFFIIRFI